MNFLLALLSVSNLTYAQDFLRNYRNIGYTYVLTEGVTIKAKDGSFTIGSRAQSSPFNQGDGCILNPRSEHAGAATAFGGKEVVIELNKKAQARLNARRSTYYGVLSLCGAPPEASGAASREIAIQLPATNLQRAERGLVEAIFESFNNKQGDAEWAFTYQGTTYSPKSWTLWVSDTPIQQTDSTYGIHTTASILKEIEEANAAQRARESAQESAELIGVMALVDLLVGGTVAGAVLEVETDDMDD